MVLGFLSEGSVPESEPDPRPSCSGSCTPPPAPGSGPALPGAWGGSLGRGGQGSGQAHPLAVARSKALASRRHAPGLLQTSRTHASTRLSGSSSVLRSCSRWTGLLFCHVLVARRTCVFELAFQL